MTWPIYALLSALFAGITALLAKVGVEDVPSNLATLIRTVVVVIFSLGIVFFTGEFKAVSELNDRAWLFLFLSGIATGLSWLCYFAALKAGPLSGVAPIDKLSFVIALLLGIVVLGEKWNGWTAVGAALIIAGVLFTLPGVQDSLARLGKQ